MGHVANILLGLSLVAFVFWSSLSVGLFVGGWLVYGAAWIIDGFAHKPTADLSPGTRNPIA